jgi:hypothetical protein
MALSAVLASGPHHWPLRLRHGSSQAPAITYAQQATTTLLQISENEGREEEQTIFAYIF